MPRIVLKNYKYMEIRELNIHYDKFYDVLSLFNNKTKWQSNRTIRNWPRSKYIVLFHFLKLELLKFVYL